MRSLNMRRTNKNKATWTLMALGVIFCCMQPAFAQSTDQTPIKIGSDTQLVPEGTMLKITFNTAMDSRISAVGDPFTASVRGDFAVPSAKPGGAARIILPKGTIIRGRVDTVKKPGLFSHGGSIGLTFDHVVLPSGELMPLTLNLAAENHEVKRIGKEQQYSLYSDPGIGVKMDRSVQAGKQTFSKITDESIDAGKNIAGGAGVLITAPAGVIGGAVGGAAITTGKAAAALVGKGDSVVIKPGDTVAIDFGGSFSLPAEQ
jgi:hypothetical protein